VLETAKWLINKKRMNENDVIGDVVNDVALQPTDVTDVFATDRECDETLLNSIVKRTLD
jgi:hypothetical protein